MIRELLWFLAGDTDIRYLVEHDVHIWDNDAYRFYGETCARRGAAPVDREAFLAGVLQGDEPFAGYRFGDLNRVYGYQWRSWPLPGGRRHRPDRLGRGADPPQPRVAAHRGLGLERGRCGGDGPAAVPCAVPVLRGRRTPLVPALPAQRRHPSSACRSTSRRTPCSR